MRGAAVDDGGVADWFFFWEVFCYWLVGWLVYLVEVSVGWAGVGRGAMAMAMAGWWLVICLFVFGGGDGGGVGIGVACVDFILGGEEGVAGMRRAVIVCVVH